MKKAMTILLTFIMVLQLIPIPAFATEEIATAEDLKAFLENPENVTVAEGSTLTVQISAENKFTRGSLFPYPLSGSESGSLPDPVQTCPRYGRAI